MGEVVDVIEETETPSGVDTSATMEEMPEFVIEDVENVGLLLDRSYTIMALTAGDIRLRERGTIDTATFANGDYPFFGFGAVAATEANLTELNITLGSESDATGSAAALIGTGSIIQNSVALAYLPTFQYGEFTGGDLYSTESQLFFHYSAGIENEPDVDLKWEDIVEFEDSVSFDLMNPINYGDNEAVGLMNKFGVDPTLIADTDGSILDDALGRSFDAMANLITTTYAESEKAFPRQPPLKIKKEEISHITGVEEAELETTVGVATTATTTATTAGGSTSVDGGTDY
jgi:hypothetical protein